MRNPARLPGPSWRPLSGGEAEGLSSKLEERTKVSPSVHFEGLVEPGMQSLYHHLPALHKTTEYKAKMYFKPPKTLAFRHNIHEISCEGDQ